MRATRVVTTTTFIYALHQLSCPVMATECEGVFSAAKRILPPDRNALEPKVIEACECLRLVVKDKCGLREVGGVPFYAVSRDRGRSCDYLTGGFLTRRARCRIIPFSSLQKDLPN